MRTYFENRDVENVCGGGAVAVCRGGAVAVAVAVAMAGLTKKIF